MEPGDGELAAKREKLSAAAGTGGEDRLSALPDDILIQILLRLGTACAAQTSILSRRWRLLWCLLPEFDFGPKADGYNIRAALAAHEVPSVRHLLVFATATGPCPIAEWLPVAARRLCGDLATSLSLNLGFLALAVPPSGVFAWLTDLSLHSVRFHGPCELGDAVSSPRFPSLKKLTIRNAQGLSNFIINSKSLLQIDLMSLNGLQQLSVVAPALEVLNVLFCFADASSRRQPVASISAPKLEILQWCDAFDPNSVQFGKMENLQWLGTYYFLVYGQEDSPHNHERLRLLQHFQFNAIPSLTLMLAYLPAEAECESDCFCDLPPNWTTDQLGLNFLHEVEITNLRGTEHEMAFVKRIFSWAAVLKEMTINFYYSITESTARELCKNAKGGTAADAHRPQCASAFPRATSQGLNQSSFTNGTVVGAAGIGGTVTAVTVGATAIGGTVSAGTVRTAGIDGNVTFGTPGTTGISSDVIGGTAGIAGTVTDLDDGVFPGFVYYHALSDGTAFWEFLNAWAEIARARLALARRRWSPDGGAAAPVVLPYVDLARLIARTTPPLLRERMLHSSAESLAALKERARQELLAAGDAAGAAAVTGFQALSSLLWRCVTRARRLAPDQEVVFRASVNNRGRLRPPLPAEYFGNSILATSTEAVPASELLARGHGWAAAAVGRAVAVHTDEVIRARAAETPSVSAFRLFDASGMFVSSSPRFDMYGCDFGWGKAVAARSGKANKYDGKVSLFPGREGGGSIDAEVELTPEHMAALEQDDEFWSAVKPDHLLLVNNNFP
ncbi:hypothetical protein E2562_007402 [Oryza meyeriana var. granulata]|uniref:Uncharacterized protein n=1 Tax=Oryza meyeriana var. granulata TaxID=110450 RepID=A0A6G1CZL8_9ORYZ|nr:hypothetical protein E2562_007402 [Oryza meyeriana var. granulata]